VNNNFGVVRNLPVAKFRYKGNHSKPVRRTILVVESNARWIRGYELREGSVERTLASAPIKTYSKRKIAISNKKSTLERQSLFSLISLGL
jgi:hypothetical protein